MNLVFEHTALPWKNGGGMTHKLFIFVWFENEIIIKLSNEIFSISPPHLFDATKRPRYELHT